jgi:dodecin
MTVARTTELTAQSSSSFEDAIKQGLERASKTVRNIKQAWIKEQEVVLDNDRISQFRVTMKVTFVLDD